MKSIYLSFTPFHLITSCALALNNSSSEHPILIVINDFLNAHKYINSILNWKYNPFKYIYILMGRTSFDRKPFFLKLFYQRKKVILIQKLWSELSNNQTLKLYIFNDRTVEAQFLLSKNKRYSINNFYIDDGIESYLPTPLPKYYNNLITILRRLIYKLLFGYWFDISNIIGIDTRLGNMLSFYPNLAIKPYHLKYSFIDKIPKDIFSKLNQSTFIKELIKKFKLDIKDKKSYCILLLPNTNYFHLLNLNLDYIKSIYYKIIKVLEENFDLIYLKYHPRENNLDFLQYKSEKLSIIDNSIGMELIFFLLNSKEKSRNILIGLRSTALITARLIMKNKITIISFYNIFHYKQYQNSILDIFQKFSIHLPKNIDEFSKLIKDFNNSNNLFI